MIQSDLIRKYKLTQMNVEKMRNYMTTVRVKLLHMLFI